MIPRELLDQALDVLADYHSAVYCDSPVLLREAEKKYARFLCRVILTGHGSRSGQERLKMPGRVPVKNVVIYDATNEQPGKTSGL